MGFSALIVPARHKESNFVSLGFRDWGNVHRAGHLNLHTLGVLSRDEVEAPVKASKCCWFKG